MIDNLEQFLDIRKELNSPTPLVRVNFVKTTNNEFELDEFLNSNTELKKLDAFDELDEST